MIMLPMQAGLGTYTTPRFVTSLGRGISKTMDKVFAWNLASHVLGTFIDNTLCASLAVLIPIPSDGYKFLMQNCEIAPLPL